LVVESVEFIDKELEVYNFEVEDNHTYFAHGVLVHNKCVRDANGRGRWVEEDYKLKPGEREITDKKEIRDIAVKEALSRVPEYLPDEIVNKFGQYFTPEALITAFGIGAAYGAAHFVPGVGWAAPVVDGVVGGLFLVFVGSEATMIWKDATTGVSSAINAQTNQQMDSAASYIASSISRTIVDVTVLNASAGAGAIGTAIRNSEIGARPGGLAKEPPVVREQRFIVNRTGEVVDLKPTLDRIASGGTFPHRNDGSVFRNDPPRGQTESLLPAHSNGYYREYVVPTAGVRGPGSQRIVTGQGGEAYYSPDHYKTFVRVR
jgi:guanyl-specific ribonuclease Sa